MTLVHICSTIFLGKQSCSVRTVETMRNCVPWTTLASKLVERITASHWIAVWFNCINNGSKAGIYYTQCSDLTVGQLCKDRLVGRWICIATWCPTLLTGCMHTSRPSKTYNSPKLPTITFIMFIIWHGKPPSWRTGLMCSWLLSVDLNSTDPLETSVCSVMWLAVLILLCRKQLPGL